jgi:alpha-amylase/alpha-mannosidase (GH57 family)
LTPSNVDFFKTGLEVYRNLVVSAQISFKQVAAHYAITSLFTSYPQKQQVYCYDAQQLDYQIQRMGSLTLAVGQLRLVSEITWESSHLVFAVLHLGGWDFHCCIQPFAGRRAYSKLKEKVFDSLKQASAAHTILAMNQMFGAQSFSLQNLFAEERHRIMGLLSQETLTRLDQLYTQVYRDNYGVLMAFHRDELPVPQELQVAAEVALSNRCLTSIKALDSETSDRQMVLNHLAELKAIATEANHMRCQLKIPQGKETIEKLILRSLWQLLHDANPETVQSDIDRIERLIAIGNLLHLGLSLDRCQELYFSCLQTRIIPQCQLAIQAQLISEQNNGSKPAKLSPKTDWPIIQLRQLLHLGEKLAVDVSFWLSQLP